MNPPSETIKKLIKKRQLSKSYLAYTMGVDSGTISNYLKNGSKRRLTNRMALKYSMALGISYLELVTAQAEYDRYMMLKTKEFKKARKL